jgi:hypothetical protein
MRGVRLGLLFLLPFFHGFFCFFKFIFLLFLHNMDERRHKILLALVFIMAMCGVIAQLIAL